MPELDPTNRPSSRGWSVLPVFENPSYGPEFLNSLKQIELDQQSAGLSDVGMRNLLFTHTLNIRPQAILEIGTHIGAAAVVMAQALKLNNFGKLYTIEPGASYSAAAAQHLAAAGLTAWTEQISGFSTDKAVRNRLNQVAPFELIFVDANHDYAAVKTEIAYYWSLLADNGFMLFHDTGTYAVTFDSTGAGGVRRALDEIAAEIKDFNIVRYEWPIWLNPCGAAVGWKKRPAAEPASLKQPNNSEAKSSGPESESEIVRIALRETSPSHVQEFEPIVRGPMFALIALFPLCTLAAFRLVWQRLSRSLQPGP